MKPLTYYFQDENSGRFSNLHWRTFRAKWQSANLLSTPTNFLNLRKQKVVLIGQLSS